VRALGNFSGAVLLITHDPNLVELVADQLWLVADGTVKPYDGDMDEYRVFLAEKARITGRPAGRGDATGMQGKHDKKKKGGDAKSVLAPLKKQAKAAEEKLAKLSEEMKKVEAALANPTIYQPHRMSDLITAKTRVSDLKREIKSAEADWLAAEEALEAAGV